jgi:murein DD-endopeptidase MepM/ murein hydrolase activator NlpD
MAIAIGLASIVSSAACESDDQGARMAERAPPVGADGKVLAADGFDFAIGAPDGIGYYDAQPFGKNQHLGEDWNGLGGGDSDLGDPVYAIATGRVVFAEDVGGGWGNVVRVVHRVDDAGGAGEVESLYAHLEQIDVGVGELVWRGQVLGGIGTAGGQYRAHLHLEVRTAAGLDLGGGYGESFGQVSPAAFIRANRP